MSIITPEVLFRELNGSVHSGFAAIDCFVHHSHAGVLYLVKPGVALLSRPTVNLGGLEGFLSGFDESLNFPEYLEDPTTLPDGAQLCKIAGQVCYMSFGRGRTFNAQADRYFNNLKSSGHGSVFEHANFSLLLYAISRSVTHELIRHRAGFGYCLTGDTLIYSTHQVRGKPDGVTKRRLFELYVITQTPHERSRIKLLHLRCLDDTTPPFFPLTVSSTTTSALNPLFTINLPHSNPTT